MQRENLPLRERIKSTAYLFVISLLVWLGLTSSLRLQELLVGVGICAVLSLWLGQQYSRLGLPPLGAKRLLFLFAYLVVLAFEILRANLDVAYRVLHPAMPIRPGVVVIKTRLTSDIAKMILANSITLTPGTFTLDVVGDRLLIHWINVQTDDIDEASRLIGGKFERYLRVVFG
ncbi:MAG: Na+/H+ antiporter subunit E [Proteobacteria bacterium]|nr:Na+/H+ antiporter subunit E [Pseudomonadota bacterium]